MASLPLAEEDMPRASSPTSLSEDEPDIPPLPQSNPTLRTITPGHATIEHMVYSQKTRMSWQQLPFRSVKFIILTFFRQRPKKKRPFNMPLKNRIILTDQKENGPLNPFTLDFLRSDPIILTLLIDWTCFRLNSKRAKRLGVPFLSRLDIKPLSFQLPRGLERQSMALNKNECLYYVPNLIPLMLRF
jgi:hypothetical protein